MSISLEKLKQAPAGFGFSDINIWLQDVPYIHHLAEIEPIFFEELSKKELLALMTLLNQRYAKEGPAHDLFNDCYQHYHSQQGIDDIYPELTIYQDTSTVLDTSALQQTLIKLTISSCMALEQIRLPVNSPLELLSLSYLPKLTHLDSLKQLPNLKYLLINHCPLVSTFDIINQLEQLLWLDLSNNDQLSSLAFLSPHSRIVILQLLNTKLLDHEEVWQQLASLPHLKCLTISGTQKQLQALRQHLPLCVINGMTAYSKATHPLLLDR